MLVVIVVVSLSASVGVMVPCQTQDPFLSRSIPHHWWYSLSHRVVRGILAVVREEERLPLRVESPWWYG
jgi:hypothetical protein